MKTLSLFILIALLCGCAKNGIRIGPACDEVIAGVCFVKAHSVQEQQKRNNSAYCDLLWGSECYLSMERGQHHILTQDEMDRVQKELDPGRKEVQ